MNFSLMSNPAILAELGRRMRARRLRENLTQEALAEHSGVSLNTVRNAEDGRNVSFDTFLCLLRSLQALDELGTVLADSGPSPVELARRAGRVRQRASGRHAGDSDEDRA